MSIVIENSKPQNAHAQSRPTTSDPAEGWVDLDGQSFYRIPNIDRRPPFLMSITSDSDRWMYLSSTGGLTCGRADADHSLFPYLTDDKLHHCHDYTGPISLLNVRRHDAPIEHWQPFKSAFDLSDISRNLYKNISGNCAVFEEVHRRLGLTFGYRWTGSDAFGFVRTVTVTNDDRASSVSIDLIDGLQNLMPAGIDTKIQGGFSCLANAYTLCEIDPQTRLGIIALSATIVDRAIAAESLKANIIWCHGLDRYTTLLTRDQFPAFVAGGAIHEETTLRGRRGGFYIATTVRLAPGESQSWHLMADVDRGHAQVERLRKTILTNPDLDKQIHSDIETAGENLAKIVARADGLQSTADRMLCAHHFANVLFNNMRGGIFPNGYQFPASDFLQFIRRRNVLIFARHESFFAKLSGTIDHRALLIAAEETADADFIRLCHEYLPLTFGRRHGDPSRPWNQFAIRIRNPDGSPALDYQGNWRDIFQNWEALALSFPRFIESIIAKFINASTVDGFNPYRVMRDGIEWEVPEPENPWSNIGYWGDHQIIYLVRLLEASHRYQPGLLQRLLSQSIFSYAHVPYRLKSYREVLENSRDTIVFDRALADRIEKRVAEIGTDGKLLPTADGGIYHVNLLEKLLVAALSKISNLIADGGIWMNTQRPEWNDANNALVGAGVSMVTLCHLHRYIGFFIELIESAAAKEVDISAEVITWFNAISSVLTKFRNLLNKPAIDDVDRKTVMDALGQAFCQYRAAVYENGFSGMNHLPLANVSAFLKLSRDYLRHAIEANRRQDGLYHSYNLLSITQATGAVELHRLYEMLEGQVAVLNSGFLGAAESIDLLESLFSSKIYRPDQQSFMLYPDRKLSGFLRKNCIPTAAVDRIALLRQLIEVGNESIILRDATGRYRFSSEFKTIDDLHAALDKLPDDEMLGPDRAAVAELFKEVFNLHSFTGRSGTMYGYEGLGCIYWHMVSKLLVAVQEAYFAAERDDATRDQIRALGKLYYRVRQGLGFNKSAGDYGAFPMDPYSHTPGHSGAQQPGMTGQVKEEIITRFGELGIRIENGRVHFQPTLLRNEEFLKTPATWAYIDSNDKSRTIDLPSGSLAFTICQTPIVYRQSKEESWISILFNDGRRASVAGSRLDSGTSAEIFDRTGRIFKIEVSIPTSQLLNF